METLKYYQCGSVVYCDARTLCGFCNSNHECKNKIPIQDSGSSHPIVQQSLSGSADASPKSPDGNVR